MLDEKQIAREIGDFFGRYFEEDQCYCIDNGDEIFRYDSIKELLTDWVDTLVDHQHSTDGDPSGDWDEKIIFIYENVIQKWPVGVRPYYGKKDVTWCSAIDVSVPGETSAHGKSLSLGIYPTLAGAIKARQEFAQFQESHQDCGLQPLRDEAARLRIQANSIRKQLQAQRTIQEFLRRNPGSTLNLMTPSGYVILTPELAKTLLQGKSVSAHAGTDEARLSIPAEYLLSQELVEITPHQAIPNFYEAITDDKTVDQEVKWLETIDLSNCTLLGKDFSGYHFDGSNFHGTCFENINFQNAVFLNCDLSEARFINCQLDNVDMVNNDCSAVTFEGCSVDGMQMRECNMESQEEGMPGMGGMV